MAKLAQPFGSTSVEVNKQSIARYFGVKQSEVCYASPGTVLTGYRVIYDKVSQRSYELPLNIASGSSVVSISNGVLTHSNGSIDLGRYAVNKGNYVKVGCVVESGVTLTIPNEIVQFTTGGLFYRWDGTFPQGGLVIAKNTPEPSASQVGPGKYIVVLDLALRDSIFGVLASSSGASKIGTSNGYTVQEYLNAVNIVTPMLFGAKGDGVADDSAAIQAAINSSNSVYLLGRTYKVGSGVTLKAGMNLHSDGATIKTSNTGVTLISVPDVDGWSITGCLKLEGPGKSNGSGVGLKVVDGAEFLVENVQVKGIDGVGFLQEGGTYNAPRGNKGRFLNCMAVSCWKGREDKPNSNNANLVNEYCTWIGFHASECQIGNVTSAGNNSFIGGKLVDNVDGLWLVGGANSTHGTMVGVQINHNSGYNINIDSTTAGFVFSGCTIFGDAPTVGAIRAVNSRGIQIVGGLMEASVYVDGKDSSVFIMGCYNNNNFALNFAGLNPECIYKSNNFVLGLPAPWNDQGSDYVNVYKGAVQNIPANTKTRVVYDSLQNYNLRKAYDLSTGIYTVPSRGVYRVTGCIKLKGTVTTAYVSINRNDIDVAYSYGGLVAGYYIINFSIDVDANKGDRIDVNVIASGSNLAIDVNPGSALSITGLW